MKKIINLLNSNKEMISFVVFIFILLSVPFSAFHSSVLGKIVLLSFILFLAVYHKILALISIVGLVLLYQSQSNMFYYNSPYEAFSGKINVFPDASGNNMDMSGNGIMSGTKPGAITFDISGNLDIEKQMTTSTTTGTTGTTTGTTTTSSSTGQEGFDLLGTEDTLRKGKQSNTIHTKKTHSGTNSFLLPFENSKYTDNFMMV